MQPPRTRALALRSERRAEASGTVRNNLDQGAASARFGRRPYLRVKMDRLEVFGRTVSGVLGDPQWDSTQRSLAGVEIWAGKKTAASAAKQRGLEWGTVEINDGPDQDLTTAIGFLYGISLIMAVAEGGLAVLAPVCSSFVFLRIQVSVSVSRKTITKVMQITPLFFKATSRLKWQHSTLRWLWRGASLHCGSSR